MQRTVTTVVFDAEGNQVAIEESTITVQVPASVTPAQMRMELRARGLLAQVPALLASLPDGVREDAEIRWEYATQIDRTDPLIMQMAAALGFTDEQADEFFILASER